VLVTHEELISHITRGVELCGVGVIIVGGICSLVPFVAAVARRRAGTAYDELRRALGRSILLGLEILVGADIIRTIAISPSFTSVGVLGLIVVVRTFLSFSLEAELDGQWPWQRRALEQPVEVPHEVPHGDPPRKAV
jgi:uncharacterized membrane protein